MDLMENGLKLDDIFDKYPENSDQRMIGDFWFKLVEFNAMLLKKAEKHLKKIYKNY